MPGTRTAPTPPDGANDVVGIFLAPNGRLPGFAQRRLDDLIAKKRSEGLTRKEQRELSEALDYIDAKTIELLEHALVVQSAEGNTAGRPSRAPRGERVNSGGKGAGRRSGAR